MSPDAGWAAYYELAARHPDGVNAISEALAVCGNRGLIRIEELLSGHDAGMSYDELRALIGAFARLGLLVERADGTIELDTVAFAALDAERQRAVDALRWATTALVAPGAELLLAAARADEARLSTPFERLFADLRTSVRALIVSAHHKLVLAAPYWDENVAADMRPLLERRAQAGVRIELLARRPRPGSPNQAALALLNDTLSAAGQHTAVKLLELPSSRDPFGTATFHFKVAVADRERAYLGSANFNTAGMASRWELGVLLRGPQATTVSDFVGTLFDFAVPYPNA